VLRNARNDNNQTEIVHILRLHGAKVRSVSQLKKAFDLLVFYKGQTFIVEVKNGNKPLTEGELEFKEIVESVGVKYWVIRNVTDALEMIGK